MRKIRTTIIIIGVVLLLVAVFFFLMGSFRPKPAGLSVQTSPSAEVLINGISVGRTPYETTRAPGEITLRLIPEAKDKPLSAYETRMSLVSGIQTVVKREFAEMDETASGEIISFEKIGGEEAGVAVVSVPNDAEVFVDGLSRGFAPTLVSPITPGEHQLVISARGYASRTLKVKAIVGYKLTAIIKLAPAFEGSSTREEKPPQTLTLVEILTTPTGFLRVRAAASASAEEVARVSPGEKFLYLDQNEAGDWFKIEYAKDKEGWVKSQYVKKFEGTLTPTATPSAQPVT